MDAMNSQRPPYRRVLLVPAAAPSSRGDELVRRYRLAVARLDGHDVPVSRRPAARPIPEPGGGTLAEWPM
jgi:hypothetical protein